MSDSLDALEDWASHLLARVAPAERARMAQAIALKLRRSQQRRITAQKEPDGTAFEPRKRPPLRQKQGRIRTKAKMFQKLKAARHLKARGRAQGLTVGFEGRVSRIARVHQDGLRDRPRRDLEKVQYERRRVLGLSAADREMIRDELLERLA